MWGVWRNAVPDDFRQVRIVTKRDAIETVHWYIRPTGGFMKRLLLFLALATAIPCAVAADNIKKINGSISTEAHRTYGNLETVNGSIQLATGVQAGVVETVNGTIGVDNNVQATSIDTVNGHIRAGRNLVLSRGLETVNGGIYVDRGSRIGANVETVNGAIGLVGAVVEGDIETVNGDITVGIDSHVKGGITVTRSSFGLSLTPPRKPRIVIGPGAVVEGTLRFDREVTLHVHDSARIGPVNGASVLRFSTDTAPQ